MQLGIHFKEFVESLPYMGIGMLGIFVVIAAIYGSIALLNRVFSPNNKE